LKAAALPPILTLTAGEVQVLLDALELIGSAETLTVIVGTAAIQVPISTLALSSDILQNAISAGGVGIPMDVLEMLASINDLTIYKPPTYAGVDIDVSDTAVIIITTRNSLLTEL